MGVRAGLRRFPEVLGHSGAPVVPLLRDCQHPGRPLIEGRHIPLLGDVESPFWADFGFVRSVFAALAAALAAAVLAGPAAAANPEIAALQVGLRSHGIYKGTVDGVLGPGTSDAVRRFQLKAGLPADGVAGAKTRAALGKYGRRAPARPPNARPRHARLGRCRAPVFPRMARLSVGTVRRSPRPPNAGGSPSLPGVGRARGRRHCGALDHRGAPRARASLPAHVGRSRRRSDRRPLRPPRRAVSQRPRLHGLVRHSSVSRSLGSGRVRGPAHRRLGEPRGRQACLRCPHALRASLADRREARTACLDRRRRGARRGNG